MGNMNVSSNASDPSFGFSPVEEGGMMPALDAPGKTKGQEKADSMAKQEQAAVLKGTTLSQPVLRAVREERSDDVKELLGKAGGNAFLSGSFLTAITEAFSEIARFAREAGLSESKKQVEMMKANLETLKELVSQIIEEGKIKHDAYQEQAIQTFVGAAMSAAFALGSLAIGLKGAKRDPTEKEANEWASNKNKAYEAEGLPARVDPKDAPQIRDLEKTELYQKMIGQFGQMTSQTIEGFQKLTQADMELDVAVKEGVQTLLRSYLESGGKAQDTGGKNAQDFSEMLSQMMQNLQRISQSHGEAMRM